MKTAKSILNLTEDSVEEQIHEIFQELQQYFDKKVNSIGGKSARGIYCYELFVDDYYYKDVSEQNAILNKIIKQIAKFCGKVKIYKSRKDASLTDQIVLMDIFMSQELISYFRHGITTVYGIGIEYNKYTSRGDLLITLLPYLSSREKLVKFDVKSGVDPIKVAELFSYEFKKAIDSVVKGIRLLSA